MRNFFMLMIACLAIASFTTVASAQDNPISWKHEISDQHIEVVFVAHQELTQMEVVAKNLRTKRSATFKKRSMQLGESWRVRLQKPDEATDYRVDFKGAIGHQTFEGYYTFSAGGEAPPDFKRSEEHTSELQSRGHLV